MIKYFHFHALHDESQGNFFSILHENYKSRTHKINNRL